MLIKVDYKDITLSRLCYYIYILIKKRHILMRTAVLYIYIYIYIYSARRYYDNFVSSISHDARSNLPTNQQAALKDLSSNNDIVMKEADKGGAITIINKEDYITDCNTLLEDNSTYHKTTSDMMEAHLKEAKNLFTASLLPTNNLFLNYYQPNPNQVYSMSYPSYIGLNNSSLQSIIILILTKHS